MTFLDEEEIDARAHLRYLASVGLRHTKSPSACLNPTFDSD
jgi:hypothetical protein